MGVVVMDKKYEKTRFSGDSIKESKPQEQKKTTIADLEEQIRILKLEKELEELKAYKEKSLSPKSKK